MAPRARRFAACGYVWGHERRSLADLHVCALEPHGDGTHKCLCGADDRVTDACALGRAPQPAVNPRARLAP